MVTYCWITQTLIFRFSPAILFFLISIIPTIWILELHHQKNKSRDTKVIVKESNGRLISFISFRNTLFSLLCKHISCCPENVRQIKILKLMPNALYFRINVLCSKNVDYCSVLVWIHLRASKPFLMNGEIWPMEVWVNRYCLFAIHTGYRRFPWKYRLQ